MSGYGIIKTKKQYNEYCAKLMELSKGKVTAKVKDDMELLDLLIAKWEADNLKNDEMDPIELLTFLMENHSMTRNDLMEVLGVNKGTVSKILNYRKGLSKEVIRKLAEKFKLSQDAFNKPYVLVSEANKGHRDEKMMNTPKELEPVAA